MTPTVTARPATPGMRVFVVSGDQRAILGEGTLVGYATVYGFRNRDGTRLTIPSQPETPLTPFQVQLNRFRGLSPIRMTDNPKIQLDDGTIVYGCQVWWGPLEAPDGNSA